MTPEPYISTMQEQLRYTIQDIKNNASLYTKSELEGFRVLAQELASTVTKNLDNDNYFDC